MSHFIDQCLTCQRCRSTVGNVIKCRKNHGILRLPVAGSEAVDQTQNQFKTPRDVHPRSPMSQAGTSVDIESTMEITARPGMRRNGASAASAIFNRAPSRKTQQPDI
jgi:hypothetical protein